MVGLQTPPALRDTTFSNTPPALVMMCLCKSLLSLATGAGQCSSGPVPLAGWLMYSMIQISALMADVAILTFINKWAQKQPVEWYGCLDRFKDCPTDETGWMVGLSRQLWRLDGCEDCPTDDFSTRLWTVPSDGVATFSAVFYKL